MDSEQHLAFRIKSLSNQIKRLMERSALADNDAGLTGMQYGMLGFIAKRGKESPVYQRDIEAEFNIRRPTATGILQKLEKSGFIRREATDSDARLKRITLTDKAIELDKNAHRNFALIQAKLTDGLTEEELAGFYAVLDKIAENAK